MTATRLGAGAGTPGAVVLGGWGQDEEGISPTLLSCTADLTRADRAAVEAEAAELAGEVEPCAYAWRRLQVAGAAPEGRAFHTTTEVLGTLLVYGGLGQACCRSDVALLDLTLVQWSAPLLTGVPRCPNGRAGHGACFFPSSDGNGGGELLLLSGASRSPHGDAHQNSLDVIKVVEHRRVDPDGAADGGAAVEGGPAADGGAALGLAWSDESAWARVQLPEVRTGTYVQFARSVACWSGIGQTHDPEESLLVIDVDKQRVREVRLAAEPRPPVGRGGAVAASVSPFEAIVLCGSDHSDGEELLVPHVLKVVLTS